MSDHWSQKGRYAANILDLKKQLSPAMLPVIDRVACFGWLWKDPRTLEVCPEKKCALRSHCESVWSQVQAEIGAASKKPRSENTRRKTRKRDKWKYDKKYERVGYKRKGKPIDGLVDAWDRAFHGVPYSVKWSRSDREEGPLIKVTASYRAFVVKKTIVARMWTNTTKRAVIDIVPELVTPITHVVAAAEKLGVYHVSKPVRTPQRSWKKLRPCTARVTVFTPEGAYNVARTILEAMTVPVKESEE